MKKITWILFSTLLLTANCFAQKMAYINEIGPISNKLNTLTPQEMKEPAVVLSEKVLVEFAFEAKELYKYQFCKRRVHLNENTAIEQFNRIYLPIENNNEIVALKAVAIGKNGQQKEVGKDHVKQIEEEGRQYSILAIEGLEEGGELEYYYCLKQNLRLFGSERIQKSTFIRNYQLSIISPDHLIWEGKIYNASKPFIATIDSVEKKRTITVELNNIEQAYDEKYSASDANLIRAEYKIAYNKAKSDDRMFTWAQAGKRFYEIYHEGQQESESVISRLANELGLKGKSEEDAARTIENYIKTNIVIRQNSEPASIKDVLTRKYGTKENVYQLYIFLFDYLNIPNQMVLCSNRFEKKFDKDFDTWNFLDDVLFYLPVSKRYISPDDITSRFGAAPDVFAGSDALFIKTTTLGGQKTGIALTKKIEELTNTNNNDDMWFNVDFSENMSQIKATYKRMLDGYAATEIRPFYFLANEEDRKMALNNIIKAYTVNDAEIKNPVVENFNLNTEEINKPFTITADINSKSVIEKAGNKIILKVGELIGPQVQMYNEKPRQNPIEIQFPHAYHRIITVNIPKGYTVKGLDALKFNLVYKNEELSTMGFVSAYTLENNVLKIDINEYYNNITYPKSAYADFVKIINASADFNKISIVLEKGI
ncbi:hypothetical protein C3K47_11415 [Solitalea longa]|uniref:Uncharacterized protein n=1 Tax=Solitalea longa TaxID=2079460 RepID=A0A2S5A217_9SPHI|nr:transglutaminase domain-containing protein [Solitalea longa]POY36349.1 hypothetical protein C3K47_11415 [Solitalea longa]